MGNKSCPYKSVLSWGLITLLAVIVLSEIAFAPKIQATWRAHCFATYLFKEVDCAVDAMVTAEDIERAKNGYLHNPAAMEQYVAELSEMKTGYIRSIKMGAKEVNEFDKTLSFEEIYEIMREENHNLVAHKLQYEQVKALLVGAQRGIKLAKVPNN